MIIVLYANLLCAKLIRWNLFRGSIRQHLQNRNKFLTLQHFSIEMFSCEKMIKIKEKDVLFILRLGVKKKQSCDL